MVGVVVQRDAVAAPEPISAVAGIKGSHAEVVAAKPETSRAASDEMPHMAWPEAIEVAVFPGMVEMETDIFASPVVANPFAIPMNVWHFGMTFMVAKGGVLVARRTVISRRTMMRNIATAVVVMIAVIVLREAENREGQAPSQKRKDSQSQ